jgi:RNA polymerase sigma-70 factor (ECF subfamily)
MTGVAYLVGTQIPFFERFTERVFCKYYFLLFLLSYSATITRRLTHEKQGSAEKNVFELQFQQPNLSRTSSGIEEIPANEIYCHIERFRSYLLAIANAEMPDLMRGTVGASDLVQETMMKGAEIRSRFGGSTDGELRAWLRAILFNILSDYRRKYSAQQRYLVRESLADRQLVNPRKSNPLDLTLARECSELIAVLMSNLPANYREIIGLRHRENLSFAEIGHQMQITEEAARKCWKRAVEQFRKELHRHDAEFR